MKYPLEFKLECIEKHKKGIRIDLPPGVKHLRTFSHSLRSRAVPSRPWPGTHRSNGQLFQWAERHRG